MPLSRLAVVSNFSSNSLSPFLSIVRIICSQAISLQTFFTHFSHDLLYLNLHKLTYLGINVSTHDMTIPPQTALSDHILNLHNNTHPITKDISRHPINQSHPTHHPDHTRSAPCNLASSATASSQVSQQYNKTSLIQH